MLTQSNTNNPVPLGGLGAVADERRVARRSDHGLSVSLTAMGCTDVHLCKAENISEGGLLVYAPSKLSLRVGQRCEITFTDESGTGGVSTLAGERCYATVVRTERATSGAQNVTAAGLRFDQPLFL